MQVDDRILITGGTGFVGSNLADYLVESGFHDVHALSSKECDLTDRASTVKIFSEINPKYIFMVAGRVGGIKANRDNPIEFFESNVLMAMNSLHAASVTKPVKCIYLGSSCIYPKMAPQPIPENSLLDGHLEPTNEAYALAKIDGIKLASYYRKKGLLNIISVMPPNVYGPKDNFDLENSHVLSALIRRFHEAKEDGRSHVTLWGTGEALREFIYARDLARALHLCMDKYDGEIHINSGTGDEISISNLASIIKSVVGYEGSIQWDSSMPNGTPRKCMDNSKIRELGFKPDTSLVDGIKKTYEWFLKVKSS